MSTGTRATVDVLTTTANDVRNVMADMSVEIATICKAVAGIARDFNVDSAISDTSILVLNDVVSVVRLQFYAGDQLVREYAYFVADQPLEAFGPGADQPPLGYIPEHARVRLVVTPNPKRPADYSNDWFRRLGWSSAPSLVMPENASHETYGTHVSGGFGVERKLLVNPKFDRPLSMDALRGVRKEG